MAENKRYFWLRLYDDFFTSKRIKKLRALAGGDTYTIIYLKMQLKAIKDDGYLYFDSIMTDFAEELALDIDESPDDVRVTIQYLMTVGLLECSENGEKYFLTYLPNLIGSETASTQRSRDCRKRKKDQEMLQCNTSATQVQHPCNAEIDIEIDIDKEIEKEKDIDNNPPNPPSGGKGRKKDRKKLCNRELMESFFQSNPNVVFSDGVMGALYEWCEYKEQKKKRYAAIGMKNLLNDVFEAKKRYGEYSVEKSIRRCMASNYDGIFYSQYEDTENRKMNAADLIKQFEEEEENEKKRNN